jgi:DNA polymerase-3 subunit alpha
VPKMIAMEVSRPELVLDGGPPVRLRTKPGTLSEARIAKLKELLMEHPGESQVFVQLETHEKVTVLRLGDEFCVDPTNGLFAELRILLGADCIA